MSEAVHDLVRALEADTLADLVGTAQKEGASPLSANLCEGLLAFQDRDLKANLDFSVAWSPRLEPPPTLLREKVRIQWDYFPRIEQVRTALRPEQAPKAHSFVGTVDELKGDFGPDEPMEGEVFLDLLVDGESVKAKAYLVPEYHRLAHQAYASPKPYVKIVGLLHPGHQPRKLTSVTEFVILER